MPRNGAGAFSLATPGNPVVTGSTVSSTWANNTLSDIATAITQSIAVDGQSSVTANIPMNSKKITGLAAPTTSGDALSYGQSVGPLTATTGTFSGAVSGVGYSFTGTSSGTYSMSATGVPYGSALHNNAGAVTGTVNQYICSGTYTPTINAGANVSGSPAASGTFRWTRVGNVVSVSGALTTSTLTSAGGTATIIYLTLPIASAMTLTTQLAGTAGTTVADTWHFVQGEPATDRAELNFAASTTSGHTYYLTFSYEIL